MIANNDLDSMINTIMQWSNVNSGSLNVAGLDCMSGLLSQAFSVLECERSIIPIPPIERIDSFGVCKKIDLGSILRFTKREKAPIKVLLMGHMDTVFDINHPFQKSYRKTPDEIVGPGVTDMKGGLVILLESLKIFEQYSKKENLGWEVIINTDEEIGSLGSAPYFMERAKDNQVGLLFEPAMDEIGSLAGDRKGSAKFTFVVHGKAAHAGRDFSKGASAIYAIASLIKDIENLNGKKEKVTFNVGHITGGGSTNIVPDLAICRLDVRTHQMSDELWVNQQLENIVSKLNQQPDIKVDLHGKFTRPPKVIEGKTKELYHRVKEIAASLGQTLEVKPSGGCCDGNNLAAGGLPNIDSLGVSGGNIHSDQEYFKVSSLVPRIDLTVALLKDFCEHGI